MKKWAVVLALVAATALGLAQRAHAATYTVCGYSYSAGGSAPDSCMSLATAVSAAIATNGSDTINMLPGNYCPIDIETNAFSPITFAGVGTQAMTGDAISAYSGPEAALSTIKYDPLFCGDSTPSAVVWLNTFVSSGEMTFRNVQIDAAGVQYGLFVSNSENVLLRDVIVTGAGIAGVDFTSGPSSFIDYSIDIDHSAITANGAGVIVSGFGSVYATMVYGNSTGIALTSGEMSLSSDTITNNETGVNLNGSSQTLSSIVAGNTEDCKGSAWETMFSQFNLTGSSCPDTDGNDITYDAGDGAIADPSANGGPTPSILPPSQAQGAGGTLCGLNGTDQREAVIGSCDIGSVDVSSASAAVPADSGDVDFGTIGTGAVQTTAVYASNAGGDLMGVSGIDISGTGWSIQATNCAYPLITHDSANCSATIRFSSPTAGTFPGTLTFHTTAGDDPVALTATTIPAPAASFDTTSLSFPDTNDGSSAAPQVATLTNIGQAELTITSITLAGTGAADYGFKTTCGSTLAVAAHCTATVTFAPKLAGERDARLVFADNASDTPQQVSLSGVGIGTSITISKSSLTFATTLVGKASATQAVTLKNVGTLPLIVSALAFIGPPDGGDDARTTIGPVTSDPADWSVVNGCTAKVAVGKSCVLTLKFQPTQAGDLPNQLAITDDAGGSPQLIQVDGTGIQGDLTMDNNDLSFDDTLVKHKSDAQTVTLGNDGTAPITLSSIKLTGVAAAQFNLTKTCGATLAVSGSCVLTIRFAPTKAGVFAATVAINDNGAGHPHAVTLGGTALPIPTATATPATLTFTATLVSPSGLQTVTLTNTSTTTPLDVSNVKVVDAGAVQFEIGLDGCSGQTVAPSGTCTVTVQFAPTKKGAFTAHLQFTDTAATMQKSLLKGTAS